MGGYGVGKWQLQLFYESREVAKAGRWEDRKMVVK